MAAGALAVAAWIVLGGAAAPAPGYRVDVAGMDRSVLPGDDFFAYANGGWIRTAEIPADRSSWGAGSMLEEKVNQQTQALIEDAGKSKPSPGSPSALVGVFYAAYMDEGAIERRGLGSVQPELDAIARIGDRASLARVLGSGLHADVDALNCTNFHTDRIFGLWTAPAFSSPDHYVAYLLQGGLGLPDRDDYLNTDERTRELQGRYRAHIQAVLELAKQPDAAARAARAYELEAKIAKVHVSRTDSVDVQKANNAWPLAEFSARAPGLDWTAYFEAAGLASQPMIMVWHPSATAGIAALVGGEPLEAWKDYLTYRALDRSSALLPKAFADEAFHFYGTALTGATRAPIRSKRAVRATSAALGDAVGRLYVERYFPPEYKMQGKAMVDNIVAAFRRRIDALDWMSAATKAKARAKLDTLYVGIGYPEHWRDDTGLVLERDDALGNQQRVDLFRYRAAVRRLGKPVDKADWCMTAQTVDAVNLPLQNALNFPAAIMNPPFFDGNGDPVQNYGAMGSIIGHEISHSFDDQGAQFDAEGRLVNWWTPEDLARFQAAGRRLVAQYDAYEPLPGLHVNGKLTLSENIADVAGVSASFDGYRAAYGGKLPEVQGFTPDQRFFIAFGQAWRRKSRPESLRMLIRVDGHAPAEFRADTVRNVDAWYAAFAVQPNEKLYLDRNARVGVW
ncbi:MAG TPA: M13 family metallopeptidase [Thermoanaerobaculia bacterium]|nr:M13 family metallopeptidase [Thermoanaerobaculia bacterium]